MSYVHFDAATPDPSVGSRTDNFIEARDNGVALADMLAALGWMDNFNFSITAGPADAPTQTLQTNGSQVVKTDITYGSGATAGLPTVIVLSKSTNSGSTYDSIRTCTISYDGSGNLTATTWS